MQEISNPTHMVTEYYCTLVHTNTVLVHSSMALVHSNTALIHSSMALVHSNTALGHSSMALVHRLTLHAYTLTLYSNSTLVHYKCTL